MSKNTQNPIGVASATYRKASNAIAERLKVNPDHSEFPEEDFFRIVGLIDPNSTARAIKFYDIGVRRGLKQATDWFADGTIKYRDHSVVAPERLTVKSKIKFCGSKWRRHRVHVKTEDVGFE